MLQSTVDTVISKKSDSDLRAWEDIRVWEEYRRHLGTVECRPALSELLRRHRAMLNSLAAKVAYNNKQIADRADFEQDAVMGAILAYNRYNPERGGGKFYMFVRRTVSMYLLSCRDEHASIGCPSQTRAMRGYFLGRLDTKPRAKAEFERKRGLHKPQTLETEREKVRGLMLEFESLPDDWGGKETSSFMDTTALCEDDIVTRVEIELRLRKLTDRQWEVYKQVFEEQVPISEVAAAMHLEAGEVRAEVSAIRKALADL